MAKQKSTEPIKRIPDGTRVSWRARYPSDPLNMGVIRHFAPAGDKHPKWGWNTTFDVYIVEVDKTPTGGPRKTPKIMRPFASRLEAQNPDALK